MNARICMFSQRNLSGLVSRCGAYEYEDVIRQTDDVDSLTPELYHYSQFYDYYKLGKQCSNWLARNAHIRRINPGVKKIKIVNDYELFIAFFQFPHDISSLNAIIDWRKRCRLAVCWIDETWVGELNRYKETYKLLREFDYILINCENSIKIMELITNRKCIYMAQGTDVLRFCPYPNPPTRSIDVYNMGRRLPMQHDELLTMSNNKEIFYMYDTIIRMETAKHREHRDLFSNILKRSKYFIVNMAKAYLQSETRGQIEIGLRYYEGAGAGTIMIGEAVPSEDYKKDFDWDDAVIPIPNGQGEINKLIKYLDKDPARLERIRKTSIVQSLLRHDWVYRWKDILKLLGMEERPQLLARENKLKELARIVERA